MPATLAPALPPDTLRPLSAVHRVAFAYANDLFFGTDYYFTQGLALDVVSPALGRWAGRRALGRGPAGSTRAYGVAVRYDGFTPLRIEDDFIRVGDRPYAAYFYAALYRVSERPATGQRFSRALDVGYLGPAAGGKQVQTGLHALTHNAAPRGWDYQVRSDVVLGYRLGYEQRLLAAGRWLELTGSTDLSLGTLYTYLGAGGRLRVGRFASYFAKPARVAGPAWQLYAEATLGGRLVGYDATLQDGLLNRSSPYTLSFAEVRHAVPRGTASLVVTYRSLSFTATATTVGPEFANGRTHRWGTLVLAREF